MASRFKFSATVRRSSASIVGAAIALAYLAGASAVTAAPGETGAHPTPWSFARPAETLPPAPAKLPGMANPIDAFIAARLHKEGLSSAPQASRLVLLRRAYFDLVGLPPTPDEVQSFVHDDNPDAYAHLIDRLLASPQYGERWGRHWLDVVRYADSGGFEADHFYPHAWKYRDYVIRSFNADKPFDRFVPEQIAGDEFWPDNSDAVTATALYCVGPALEESAMSNQLEYEWLTDCADTTGAAFLGLTTGCARCHDHKYDPITQTDYFALQAFFAASDRPYPAKIRTNRLKALNGILSETSLPDALKHDPRCTIHTEEQAGGFHLFHRGLPMEVHRLNRGELASPREQVAPAIPAIFRSQGDSCQLQNAPADGRRAALARWICSPDNPLTARVLVNRVWAWHFGQGLVRTTNDFGNQGELPTHPRLLDWLAVDFVKNGWSLKHLHRLIMLSAAYRMDSKADNLHASQVDPEDRLLWHFPRKRLEGEAIRDAMLACAGTLNTQQFGPPVVPPLSGQELAGLFDAGSKWPADKDAAQYTRRSVYLLARRTFAYPMLAAFDGPELMNSCPRRFQTTVPAQALTLLNSPVCREQAQAFAKRLLSECGDGDRALVSRAFLLAFDRPATDREIEHSTQFLRDRTRQILNDHGSSPREMAVAEFCLALFNANEFVFVD